MPDPAVLARRGLMFVLSAPSGTGKSTISRQLRAADEALFMSVSATTRAPRPGEVEGRDYYFKTTAEIESMIAAGDLLEHAEVFGRHYGTPRAPVEAALASGRDVMFDIDWQGHRQLKDKAPGDVVSVFILPPSMAELERRLRGRAQDSEDVMRGRMAKARSEISHWADYDYVIVNEDLDSAVAQIRSILAAERLRRARRTGLTGLVSALMA